MVDCSYHISKSLQGAHRTNFQITKCTKTPRHVYHKTLHIVPIEFRLYKVYKCVIRMKARRYKRKPWKQHKQESALLRLIIPLKIAHPVSIALWIDKR